MTLEEFDQANGRDYILINRAGFPPLRLYVTGARAQAVGVSGQDGWQLIWGNGTPEEALSFYRERLRRLTEVFSIAKKCFMAQADPATRANGEIVIFKWGNFRALLGPPPEDDDREWPLAGPQWATAPQLHAIAELVLDARGNVRRIEADMEAEIQARTGKTKEERRLAAQRHAQQVEAGAQAARDQRLKETADVLAEVSRAAGEAFERSEL